MKKSKYRSAPISSSKLPSGIPFIVGNEAAERFSYYGMRAILVVFMTQYMLDSAGAPDLSIFSLSSVQLLRMLFGESIGLFLLYPVYTAWATFSLP
jgi:dipeptide/tripeptide permease